MEPGNKITPRYDRYGNVEETEYDVVDSEQKMFDVHIHQARSPHFEREYADRDFPLFSSAQSLCSNTSGSPAVPSRFPKRGQHCIQGPAVNRHLKPGRRTTLLDETTLDMESKKQNIITVPHRSPKSLSNNMVNLLSELELQKPCRKRDKKRRLQHGVCDTSSEENETNNTTQRHSLDLDSQQHPDTRLLPRQYVPEFVTTRRQNHEWPQTKDDVQQHDFSAKEKPSQKYNEQDWYIGGACDRTAAEHVLHLVNKDGAFLVRNCSKNSISEPYVLSVFHGKKVYNVKIRFIDSTGKYALGTGQRSNDMFDSVLDIIKFHSIFPVALIGGRNLPTNTLCVLMYPITKEDVRQLLE